MPILYQIYIKMSIIYFIMRFMERKGPLKGAGSRFSSVISYLACRAGEAGIN